MNNPSARLREGSSCVFAADAMELSEETVGALLQRRATEQPSESALIWLSGNGTEVLSWSELYARACGVAGELRRCNPSRHRVALVSFNSVDWIVAMFGAALAGMAVVPISASVTDVEAAQLLGHAQVGMVLSVAAIGDDAVLERMRAVAGGLASDPTVRDIAEITTLTAQSATTEVGPSDEFLVQYTSGTTGLPKAASLSHRTAINVAALYAQACGAQPGEAWLNPLPLHHVGGSISGLIVTLTYGGGYIVMDRFSPQSALRAVREVRPALVGLVPTMIIDLLGQPGVSATDFASVRVVNSGATAVDPALIDEMEKRLSITFMVAYGQSEAPIMTASEPTDPVAIRTKTLGRCLPGRDYRVNDREGRVVPLGTVGELCVRGPLIMSGYLTAAGSLDPACDGEGWLHTGDLVSMDDGGVLTFRGRIREVIIRGGVNVYPAEVEQALSTHDSIAEIAVFGVTDQRLGERVVAAVIPASGVVGRVAPTALALFAATRLSRQKRPSEWIVVSAFPRTTTGKVHKHLLRQWHEAGTLASHCAAPPR